MKYKESIIAIILFAAVLFVGTQVFLWMISPIEIPNEGIWYCEALNTTCDFEKTPAVMVQIIGETEQTYRIDCTYSGKIYYADGQAAQKELFGYICKEILPVKNSFTCILHTTDEKHTFFRIA